MSYNRTFAKARAVQRVQDRPSARTFPLPNIDAWGADFPPYTPRCHRCGSRATTRAGRCPICGAAS